jgi:hypothetical protein
MGMFKLYLKLLLISFVIPSLIACNGSDGNGSGAGDGGTGAFSNCFIETTLKVDLKDVDVTEDFTIELAPFQNYVSRSNCPNASGAAPQTGTFEEVVKTSFAIRLKQAEIENVFTLLTETELNSQDLEFEYGACEVDIAVDGYMREDTSELFVITTMNFWGDGCLTEVDLNGYQ